MDQALDVALAAAEGLGGFSDGEQDPHHPLT
jgi:hypothetical protein